MVNIDIFQKIVVHKSHDHFKRAGDQPNEKFGGLRLQAFPVGNWECINKRTKVHAFIIEQRGVWFFNIPLY